MKGWKIQMPVEERIALQTVLMQCQGSYGEHVLAAKLAQDLLPKEEAIARNIQAQGNMLTWNKVDADGNIIPDEITVFFGPEARDLVVRNLATLNEAKALDRMHLPLYERFMLTPWPNAEPE